MHYLGAPLELMATDVSHEWMLKMSALIQSAIVLEGSLKPTFAEDWLNMRPSSASSRFCVPLSEIKASQRARLLLGDMTKDETGSMNCLKLQAIVRDARAKLLDTDATFAIEVAYIKSA